ncbi:MAG: dienelactone hydrolase family protein [Chromatiaceae bacterium]|nr:dienelactone hydrolase family protein [Chromatiaceae bacterium]
MKLISMSGLFVLISLTVCGCQTTPVNLPAGVSPVSATWLNGRYTIPGSYLADGRTMTYEQEVDQPAWTTLLRADIKPAQQVPVVLYMHGCTGWSHQDDVYRTLLTAEGYAVFMPNSFARPGRRQCREQGALADRVTLRTAEVEYALAQIHELEWVDRDRVILMGYSEGGNTTDNWSKPGFAAHMIMGSACTLVGGSPAAPQGVPVLAVVGENDSYRPGLSCFVERTVGGSESIVIPGGKHAVAEYPQTQQAIREFLKTCCS